MALLVGALWMASVLLVMAQEYPTLGGTSGRQGKQTGNLLSNTPGRGFLRWFDPLVDLNSVIDNWETPNAQGFPAADWQTPGGTVAFGYVEKSPQFGRAPYLWAPCVPSLDYENYWLPAGGSTRSVFEWTFNAAKAGQEYSIYVNIPTGPTDVDLGAAENLFYQQRYFVYEIEGTVNPDNAADTTYLVHDKVDTYATGSGRVRLGNGGLNTTRVFKANSSNRITVRLINTVPRDGQGNLTDTRSQICVYADECELSRAVTNEGSYVASPVVGKMKVAAPDPMYSPYPANPWRVIAARNEPMTVQAGSEIASYNMGVTGAYRHNGLKIDENDGGIKADYQNVKSLGGEDRRNQIWSWPARRPWSNTTDEINRYSEDRRQFILGLGSWNVSHAEQSVQLDNLNGNVQASLGFNSSTTTTGFKGYDYLEGDADVNTSDTPPPPTARVYYRPQLAPGTYRIEVWMPGTNTELAEAATYEVYEGSLFVGYGTLNQTGIAGWKVLSVKDEGNFALRSRFSNQGPAQPLYVTVTNRSTSANDAGKKIMADAIRFVRTADLSVRSTPIFATVPIRVGTTVTPRDVVIVPMENGKLYCLDAKGDVDSSGVPTGTTKVYWTWPSEVAGPDPNQVDGIDGKDGVAEMPTSWDTTSGFIEHVRTGGNTTDVADLLYIASTNGRVYCIDVTGRGDGTTTRRWTYPNDYPAASVPSDLGPFSGSLSYVETTGTDGLPHGSIIVPTTKGKIYTLDAAGDPTTRTTTLAWQYPGPNKSPAGSISMSAAVMNSKIYFGTGEGGPNGGNKTFFCLDAVDRNADGEGDVLWKSTGPAAAPFDSFVYSTPTVASSVEIGLGNPSTVFVGNSNKNVYALNADTGAVIWYTSEIGEAPIGDLSFSYMTTFLPSGALDNPAPPGRPVVLVPSATGYRALFARLNDDNGDPDNTGLPRDVMRRQAWGVETKGKTTSMALGARIPGGSNPWDEDFSWMYGADSAGFLYAFSQDPDYPEDSQQITTGTSPVIEIPVPTDPNNSGPREIATNARIALVLPGVWEDLNGKRASNAAGLSRADIDAALNAGTIDSEKFYSNVTRKNFEYGEALYFLVYNLDEASLYSSRLSYGIEAYVSSVGGAVTQRVTVQPSKLSDKSGKGANYVLLKVLLQGAGNNAVAPGRLDVRIGVTANRTSGQVSNITVPNKNWRVFTNASDVNSRIVGTFELSNPLALASDSALTGTVGWTVNAASNEAILNGNTVYTDASHTATSEKFVKRGYGNDLNDKNGLIDHGQSALTEAIVGDRSLMRLVYGPGKGLQNVRVQTSDLYWFGGTGSVYKPLVDVDLQLFRNFEQYPGPVKDNPSLDYPDLRRETISVTKEIYNEVENPLFSPVGLQPPTYTTTDWELYLRTPANYNAGLNRQITQNQFLFSMDVPKYQPPCRTGYAGDQFVYVDTNQPGRQLSGNVAIEAFRYITHTASIALDERLEMGTPTVDLGSLPIGSGFAPTSPWNNSSFSPNAAQFSTRTNPFYQRFSVLNQGNVNLLNLRTAKYVQDPNGSTFYNFLPSNNLQSGSALDNFLHLHTDLDPRYAPRANAVNVLQKARPGDASPTRFRTNPVRRANAFLGIADGRLFAETQYASANDFNESISDPKVAVSVPLGTPSGVYQQNVYVFEDRQRPSASDPRLKPDSLVGNSYVYEPYSDPAMILKFTVSEARLTNSYLLKTSPMADFDLSRDSTGALRPFLWSNSDPSGVRDSNGNLVVAWTSNRLAAGGGNDQPAWNPRDRTQADMARVDQSRIYIGSVRGSTPNNGVGSSFLRDLNAFQPANNSRWFQQSAGPYPGGDPTVYFGTGTDSNSARFGLTALPSGGAFNPLDPITDAGRNGRNEMTMAFVGEARRQTAQKDSEIISKLFATTLTVAQNGSVTVGAPVALDSGPEGLDPHVKIGRPAVVQSSSNSTVFFTTSSAGTSQLNWANFNGTQWVPLTTRSRLVDSLNLSRGFESVGNPSATMRRAAGGNVNIDMSFTARLRGRPNTEVFLGTLNADRTSGYPVRQGGSVVVAWGTRIDRLKYDATTSAYWADGVDWLAGGQDIADISATESQTNPLTVPAVDVKRIIPGNGQANYESILVPGTRKFDTATRVMTQATIFGGKVQLDFETGSVRFIGSIIPNNVQLVVRNTPRWLRVSGGLGVNYRSVSHVYDERFTADSSLWFTSGGSAINPANNTARVDRYVFAFTNAPTNGQDNSRPTMATYRFGITLPLPIATNGNGAPTNFTINGLAGGSYYQLDPGARRVYCTSDSEARTVSITYDGVDESGKLVQGIRYTANVTLVPEMTENAMPIGKPSNETSVSLALDPLNGPFNRADFHRPGLIWMFWASTRYGVPDVFFQTLAPRLTSKPGG